MMEKAQAKGEGEAEREGERVCLQPQHRGGSKVCALHLNGHPVTNTDEPGRVMLHSQGLYLMGKQVVIGWKSVCILPLVIRLHMHMIEITI